MHSPVTYDHMNKPFLLIVKPRSRRIVYNCLEAKILKNHDTFQINCILGVCLARLEIEFGKFFYFPTFHFESVIQHTSLLVLVY